MTDRCTDNGFEEGQECYIKKILEKEKNIEFKREIPKRHEKLLKDVIAFSNSTGVKFLLELRIRRMKLLGLERRIHLD